MYRPANTEEYYEEDIYETGDAYRGAATSGASDAYKW
jgi:hypothetical protein